MAAIEGELSVARLHQKAASNSYGARYIVEKDSERCVKWKIVKGGRSRHIFTTEETLFVVGKCHMPGGRDMFPSKSQEGVLKELHVGYPRIE